MRKFIYILLVLVLGVLLVFAGLYAWNQYESAISTAANPNAYGPGQTSYEKLLADSPTFTEAVQLFNAGDFDAALPEFREALKDTQDPLQEGRDELYIAESTSFSRNGTNYLAAIPIYKEIAANTTFAAITRAYAVQEMALLFYTNADPAVTTQIFDDQPYMSMYVATDTPLSYRHLFEYAIQFYPLGTSEARVADWYAIQIGTSAFAKSGSSAILSPDTVQSYKDIIRKDLAAADQDATRITNLVPEAAYLPFIREREAIAIGIMQETGDSSFGTIDQAFPATLKLYTIMYGGTSQDGFSRFYYALFLDRIYGASRISDIEANLTPLYTDTVYTGSPIEHFFANERTDVTGDKPSIIKLASIDPNFKAYLEKLGWTQADFAS